MAFKHSANNAFYGNASAPDAPFTVDYLPLPIYNIVIMVINAVTVFISVANLAYASKAVNKRRGTSDTNSLLYNLLLASTVFWIVGIGCNIAYNYFLNPSEEWSCCSNFGVLVTGTPAQLGIVTASYLYVLMLIIRVIRAIRPFSNVILQLLMVFSTLVYLGVVLGPIFILLCSFNRGNQLCAGVAMFDQITKFAALIFFGGYELSLGIVLLVILYSNQKKIMQMFVANRSDARAAVTHFQSLKNRLIWFCIGLTVIVIFANLTYAIPYIPLTEHVWLGQSAAHLTTLSQQLSLMFQSLVFSLSFAYIELLNTLRNPGDIPGVQSKWDLKNADQDKGKGKDFDDIAANEPKKNQGHDDDDSDRQNANTNTNTPLTSSFAADYHGGHETEMDTDIQVDPLYDKMDFQNRIN